MRTPLAGVAGALAAAALAACSIDVAPPVGGFACEADGTCRDGFACVDAICVAEPPSCVKAVAAGDGHSCAIRDDGTAWCWGRNDFGQLGDGTTLDRVEPVAVTAAGLPKLQAIAGGHDHTCALGGDGTVWCWGHNDAGQLGTSLSKTSDFHAPVQVTGLTGALAIAVGVEHSCAIRGDRVAVCWGSNGSGQLGNASSDSQNVPTAVDGVSGVTVLAAGGDTTCAVDGNHALWCWGNNERGQLGDGGRISRGAAGKVAIPDVVGVAVGGAFTCALSSPASGGKVRCFGRHESGELGEILLDNDSPVPVPVAFSGTAKAISAGDDFACLTDEPGAVWCWGENGDRQLADGTDESRPFPALSSYRSAAVVAGGGGHSCALSSSGALRCAGYNGRGQLGDGHRTNQATPQRVDGVTDAVAVAAGESHSCATLRDGTALCWGGNDSGQLGDGSWTGRPQPAPVAIAGIQQLATGLDHACALIAGGGVACWGLDERSQLGTGTGKRFTRGYPLAVPGLTAVDQLAAGGETTCAVTGGAVQCWGAGDAGQLGNSANGDSDRPVAVQMLMPNVRAIGVGYHHACAVNAGGTVSCWGANGLGQLGNATTMGSSLPVPVSTLTGVDQVVAGGEFTCARTQAGAVSCWGLGFRGQIGIDDFGTFNTPQQVTTLSGITKLTAGGAHACAIKTGGALACWGASEFGQVGHADYDDHGTPAAVDGNPVVLDVAAGDAHTCAVLEGGGVACWGDGRRGQLGDGVVAETRPVAPVLPCK